MTEALRLLAERGEWLTLECESALYVDRGRNVILCDRLPHPVTLVVKLAPEPLKSKGMNGDDQSEGGKHG